MVYREPPKKQIGNWNIHNSATSINTKRWLIDETGIAPPIPSEIDNTKRVSKQHPNSICLQLVNRNLVGSLICKR